MERKNLSDTLKDRQRSITTTNNSNSNNNNNRSGYTNPESINIINNNKPKYPWSYIHKSYGDDYLSGFSWPPRSYTCSFCKREFRSAQALGGHMNVHRRDRARLRLSPPPREDYNPHCHLINLNTNPNSNPNPNPSSSTTSPALSALCTTAHFSGSSSSKATNFDFMRNFKTRKSLFESNEEVDNGRKLMKKGEVLRLDLEIGISNHSKEDLNLELRLGYS